MTTIDTVVERKAGWRTDNDALARYATALVAVGRVLWLDRNQGFFNNDEVGEADQPGDKTTVGAGFRMLIAAGVIEAWRGTIEAQGIYGGMRASTRKGCNGHRNQLYKLVSVGVADEWLRRHGVAPAER